MKQDQIDGIRQFLATAASGISIGAAIMICVPVEVMSFAGLDNPDQSIAIRIALLAAAISSRAKPASPFGGGKGLVEGRSETSVQPTATTRAKLRAGR